MNSFKIYIAVLTSIVLVGCGGKNSEDIAKEFAMAVSNGEIKKAENMSSDEGKKGLYYSLDECREEAVYAIRKMGFNFSVIAGTPPSRRDTLKKIDFHDRLFTETTAIYKDMDREIGEEIKANSNKIKKELIAKYGSQRNIPRNELRQAFIELIINSYKPYRARTDAIFDEIIEFLNIPDKNVPYPEYTKKLMNVFVIQLKEKMFSFDSYMENEFSNIILKDFKGVDKKCMYRKTRFSEIKDIKIISVEKKSEDKNHVKLEIFYEGKESKKVIIDTESFDGTWKVTSYHNN